MDAVLPASRRTTSQARILPVLVLSCLSACLGCELTAGAGFDDDAGPDGGSPPDLAASPGAPASTVLVLPVGCDAENGIVSLLAPVEPGIVAGPALVRFLIRHGKRVTKPVPTREFLGYYDLALEAPAGERLNVSVALRPLPDATDSGPFEVQILLDTADPAAPDRRPLNLTLSFDTSSRMQGTPIQRVKQGCVALASALEAGDVISLLGWDPAQGPQLDSHPVTGPDDPVLVGHCNGLSTHGDADLGPALEAAFALALANAAPGMTNRVILVSGGGQGASVEDAALIARMAAGEEGAEVRLTAAGVGSDATPDLYDDALLEVAAAAGRGAYFFVDSAAEAAIVFGERLPWSLEPAAENPRVELALPPTLWLLPEPAEEGIGDAGPGGSPVLGYGGQAVLRRTLVSCDPGALDPEARFGLTVRYEDPAGGGTREIALETCLSALLGAEAAALTKGRAVAAWAEAVADVRGLDGASAVERLDEARAIVLEAIEELGEDPDLAEIDELIGQYRELF
jgi:hypothetical protein